MIEDLPTMKQILEQYFLLRNGKRAMTGNLDLGSNKLFLRGGIDEILLKNYSYGIAVRNIADTDWKNVYCHRFVANAMSPLGNTFFIETGAGTKYIQIGSNLTYNLKFQNDVMTYLTDLVPNSNSVGLVLKDRTTGTLYRLYVDNGVLGIEAV